MDSGRLVDALPWQTTTIAAVLLAATTLGILLRLRNSREQAAAKFVVEPPEQCAPDWQWLGQGLDRPTIKVSGSTAIQCYSPATAQFLGFVNPTTPDGIDRAVAKASAAQIDWAKTSFAQRRTVLKTLLTFLLDNQVWIARAACLDSGKTRVDAVFGEILVTAEKLRWTIRHGEKALRAQRRPTNLLMFYKRNEVRYEPLGVVAACVSWNYPFHNLMGPIISALFTGNAIIVKNSEQTAWSSAWFTKIVRSALTACGHSPELVHGISCWPQTASYLTGHPGISYMTFIGSRPVAHEVAKDAAKSLVPLCVELGGKDAVVVLDDPKGKHEDPIEIARIVSIILRGVFQSAGQNCIGIERVVAMPLAYDRLVPFLGSKIKALQVGNDLASDSSEERVDVGAMISSASFARLETIIADAVAQGARLVTGGHRYSHPKYPNAHYFEPTMLVDVTPSMRIAQEELFAPVCVLMRAESVADAISIANSTSYGLGCNVFGPVSSSAAHDQLDTVVRNVKSGMVAVNDFAVTYAVQLPFGGTRGSGYGRFAGEEGLRSLCNIKSVCVDRFPWAINTSIPSKLDYPMRPGASAVGRGIIEVGYGESWMRIWTGIKRLL